jgi:predicted O-methyltransferase YrrM
VCSKAKDFLYLDSAHLKGETKLEITEAFKLVRPGGILLGDDLDWPAVEADLSSFLADHAESTSLPGLVGSMLGRCLD